MVVGHDRGHHGVHSYRLFPSPKGIQLPFPITGRGSVTLPQPWGDMVTLPYHHQGSTLPSPTLGFSRWGGQVLCAGSPGQYKPPPRVISDTGQEETSHVSWCQNQRKTQAAAAQMGGGGGGGEHRVGLTDKHMQSQAGRRLGCPPSALQRIGHNPCTTQSQPSSLCT